MNSPDPVADSAPAAMPWYRSKIVVGLVTVVVTQLVDHIQQRYHTNIGVLGFTINDIVSAVCDALGAASAYLILHSRVTQKAAPQITLTKKGAVAASVPDPTPAAPAGAP